MKQIDKDRLKKRLLNMKEKIINSDMMTSCDLHIVKDDVSDHADLASTITNQSISLRIREQEMVKLRKINEALSKIDSEDFGLCEDCGETIGAKRLEKQPWASLCIIHAEEREKEEILGIRKAA